LVPLPPGEEANVVLYIPPTSLLLAKPSGYSRFERVVIFLLKNRPILPQQHRQRVSQRACQAVPPRQFVPKRHF
jgi:hypothetical protein